MIKIQHEFQTWPSNLYQEVHSSSENWLSNQESLDFDRTIDRKKFEKISNLDDTQ